VVCYSVLDESVFAERALRAGAAAYVMKTSDFPVLLTAIRSVHGGGLFLSEEMRGRMLQRLATATRRSQAHNFSALSNRELQVVYHIGEQRGVDEIARRLSSTSQSISVHRSRIKVKLGIRSLGDLMRFATRWVEADAGVVDPCPAPAR
jgi:DNA-binding NarL/FixJ family response regulator